MDNYVENFNKFLYDFFMKNRYSITGDWGLGIGDWGLGQSPIPNPQSPFIIANQFKFFR